MERVILVFSVLAVGSVVAKGKMSLDSVTECADPETNAVSMEIKQKNINVTHDSVSVTFDLKEEIIEDFGIILQTFKKVDGEWVMIREVVEPKFCDLIKLIAEKNASFLSNAGLPSECPIPKGQYELDEFIYNFSELPEESHYGKYQGKYHLTRNDEKVGCMMIEVTIFEEEDE